MSFLPDWMTNMSNIPEEIEAMAYLLGQSKQIDSMMMERNKELVTDSSTIKHGIDQYIQSERAHRQPNPTVVGVPHVQPHIGDPVPQVQHMQPPIVNLPYFTPSNETQLEFNLTPTQGDEIISLLKEISSKLTKQNNLIEKINAKDSSEKKPIPVLTKEPIKDKR